MASSFFTKLNTIRIRWWRWQNNSFLYNFPYKRININKHIDHCFNTWPGNKCNRTVIFHISECPSTLNISSVFCLFLSSPNALAHCQHTDYAFTLPFFTHLKSFIHYTIMDISNWSVHSPIRYSKNFVRVENWPGFIKRWILSSNVLNKMCWKLTCIVEFWSRIRY